MARHIEVTGADGRDYTSSVDAKTDWHRGVEFRIINSDLNGRITKKDARQLGFVVTIRYNSLRRIARVSARTR